MLFPRAGRRSDICGNLLPESYRGRFCSAIAHQSPATTEPAWSLIPAAMNGHGGSFLIDKCLDDYAPPVAGLS
jgi:hypothetical protein